MATRGGWLVTSCGGDFCARCGADRACCGRWTQGPPCRSDHRAAGLAPADGGGQIAPCARGGPTSSTASHILGPGGRRVIHSLPWPATISSPSLIAAWATDGLRRIAHRWQPDLVQFTFEAPSNISPELVAGRAKGRLDHALRKTGWRHGLSRKVALRSLGENTLDVVLRYIATQLDRADLADPRYVSSLADAAWRTATSIPSNRWPATSDVIGIICIS